MSIIEPTPEAIRRAAQLIRDGEVVVMPTETVYGLACDALNPKAVETVYEIKGRPAENPLIIHIESWKSVGLVARDWPPAAEALAKRFWPGPLTLVLPKRPEVPSQTTGGLDTAAVRVPAHPVALELIRESGRPLAAPSANLFMALSPTCAEDIAPEIDIEVEMILDGGPCEVGLESTVVDVTGDNPRILRPGVITRAEIQALLGRPLGEMPPADMRRSPGNYRRHYAPRAAVILVDSAPAMGAALVFDQPKNEQQFKMPKEPLAYSATLYRSLRRLDKLMVKEIFVVLPPQEPAWEAVHDRLRKASATA